MNYGLMTEDLFCKAIWLKARPLETLAPMHQQNIVRHNNLLAREHIMEDYKGVTFVNIVVEEYYVSIN